MGVTLATHIRDKQSEITHPCLSLCPQPLLSDNTTRELWFPTDCTDLSTEITLRTVLTAATILCFPAACLAGPSQHSGLISSLQQELREVWSSHSPSTHTSSHLQHTMESDCLGLMLPPALTRELPVLGRVTKPSEPRLSLNAGTIPTDEPHGYDEARRHCSARGALTWWL